MARPHGRARVSASFPQSQAVCDRCGIWYNHVDLRFQYYWAGTNLQNTNLLVCERCLDIPNQQLRTIILPPDPESIVNARVEPFAYDNTGPVQSIIAQSAMMGARTIYLNSASGFAIGNTVQVQMMNAAFGTFTLTAVDTVANTITINIPLPYVAPVNGVVSVNV